MLLGQQKFWSEIFLVKKNYAGERSENYGQNRVGRKEENQDSYGKNRESEGNYGRKGNNEKRADYKSDDKTEHKLGRKPKAED